MGSIVERHGKKGTAYQALYRKVGKPAKSKTFMTRQEAEDWLTLQETGRSVRRLEPPVEKKLKKLRVIDLIDRYETEVTPNKEGADIERARFTVMRRHPFAKLLALEVTTADIQKYVRDRLKEVEPSTINRDLSALSPVFTVAQRTWKVPLKENPVADVVRPPENPPRDRRLAADEEVRLLAACDQSRGGYLRDAVELAIETALREGELIDLQWQRVLFDRRTIKLVRSKNGEGRAVPMSRRAVAILRARNKENLEFGPVFPGLTRQALHRAFVRACERADIQDMTFHDLRHEAISRWAEGNKFSLLEISSMSGHKSLRMLKRYAHSDASRLAERLD